MSYDGFNENENLYSENNQPENNVEQNYSTNNEQEVVQEQNSYYSSANYGNSDSSNTGRTPYYENSSYDNGSTGGNNDNKNKNKKILIFSCVVLGLIVVAVLASVFAKPFRQMLGDNPLASLEQSTTSNYETIGQTEISENTTSNTSGIILTDVSQIVENAMPSVVAITSTTIQEQYGSYYDDFFNDYFGFGFGDDYGQDTPETYESAAAGSGIIIKQTDSELLVVTNNHVVAGADKLSIRFNGQADDEGVTGYIKGTDADADVAVVAVKLADIPNDVMKNIKIAAIGDSDAVKVGEGVIAIGNALGYGQSVTMGIISAKDRTAVIEDREMKLLQTDAAINGGNSGGALLNAKGEVIGINVAKYSSSGYDSASIEGMGFAIPISSVSDIIGQLETMKTRQKVDEANRGYLGISGFDVTEEDSTQYSIPQGIMIKQVKEGGPADKAGIVVDDIITKFDGQSVKSMTALTDVLQYYAAGEKVKITIAYREGRDYTEKEVEVTLGDSSSIEDMPTE